MRVSVLSESVAVRTAEDFEELLKALVGLDAPLSLGVRGGIERILATVGETEPQCLADVQPTFYGLMNQKLSSNRQLLNAVYKAAAKSDVTFNYPEKKSIAWAVDSISFEAFERILIERGVVEPLLGHLLELFNPCTPEETRALLAQEASDPSKLRKALARDVASDVLNAAAGPLAWALWPERELFRTFGPVDDPDAYSHDYLRDLQAQLPVLFERHRALVVRSVDPGPLSGASYVEFRDSLCAWISAEYRSIDNYGVLALVLDSTGRGAATAWELTADLTLFAERFVQTEIPNMFFRWKDVQAATVAHVPGIDLEAAQFSIANEGFTYRDLFVMKDEQGTVKRLVLVFQKNQRDETLIPCPACRSTEIEGNSYPTLGVRSWECQNPLCPERSVYNRGKRYAFKSLVAQAAIENPDNEIPVESVRRWQKDVLLFESDDEIITTLIQHYSLVDDPVALVDCAGGPSHVYGRRVSLEKSKTAATAEAWFWDGPFFSRYLGAPLASVVEGRALPYVDRWALVEGEAGDVLATWPDSVVDRAVTSPPYYNAREYSQWPNIYCYLYDMHRIAVEVFRVLKPGALYAFNIFDYFDNENTIVFSAMGNKRIALSALMTDVFKRIGFEFAGVSVWDKGDIQGKRGFNAGNFSPYYQSPFNCWEHILVLRKPGGDEQGPDPDFLNRVLRIHPVIKIVGGENVHGHTAPYPQELVERLLDGLPEGSLVLDPFGGSGTTARGAMACGHRGIVIEQDPEYCDLARRLTDAPKQEVIF